VSPNADCALAIQCQMDDARKAWPPVAWLEVKCSIAAIPCSGSHVPFVREQCAVPWKSVGEGGGIANGAAAR
jgi:hypothetical protein